LYVNNHQLSYSSSSGTNNISTDFGVMAGAYMDCFYYKIYDDYITSDEVDLLFHNAKNSLPNENFPVPTYVYQVTP
jgi:hypothetical protein